MAEGNWLPLESSPEVLNPFIARLGAPAGWEFTDVFGLDEELLLNQLLKAPVAAQLLQNVLAPGTQ